MDRLIPEREAFTVTDLHRALLRFDVSVEPQCLRGTCATLAFRRTQPRVDARLTTPTELRLRRSQRPFHF